MNTSKKVLKYIGINLDFFAFVGFILAGVYFNSWPLVILGAITPLMIDRTPAAKRKV